MNRSLLSARSQRRLVELQRAANSASIELTQHHSLLIGALIGCDTAMQRLMLDEHRARAAHAFESLVKLRAFLDQCCIASEVAEQT